MSAASTLINRMAGFGWIERTVDPTDRRAVLVQLSAAGEELVARMTVKARATSREVFIRLAPQDRRDLIGGLQALSDLFERS